MTTKLDNLSIELPGLAGDLQKLIADGTTFAALPADKVVPNALIPAQTLSGTDSVPVQNGRFTLGGTATATATAQILAFNNPASADDDQILKPTAGRAWLKHKLDAQISGTLGGSLGGNATFGLTGGSEASLMQYRAHQPGDKVGQAVIDDVLSFRLPLRLADVQSLRGGDILACTVHGKLGLSTQLTLADTLSAAMASLDEALGAVGVSVVTLQEGLTVAVNLSIEDDYRLVFQAGSQSGTTQVEVRKTKGRTVGGSAGLSVVADVAASPAVQQALDAYLQARLGQALSHVEPLIQKIVSGAAFESLNPTEQALARQIATRLGLTSLPQQWQDLKTRLNGLVGQLTAKLNDAVKTKIEADATLAYTRIQTEETILSCELDGAALTRQHPALLLGNFTDLLKNLAAGTGGYRLIEYLKQTEIRKEISFGLSISIGRWAASGKTDIVHDLKHQIDLENRERWSFTGQQTYTGKWGAAAVLYAFGLAAAMDKFSAAPDASQFKYSLSFGWSWNETLTPDLVAEALDVANVWGIAKPEDNDAHQNAILSQASGQVKIELEVQVSDDGVRALLAVPADQFDGAWIEAMAAALPRIPSLVDRAQLGDRVRAYLEAAGFAFQQSAQGGTEASVIATRVHPRDGESPNDVRQLQQIDLGQTDLGFKALWIATTINDRPAKRCRRVKAALDQLADAISHQRGEDQIKQVFDQIQDLITRPYEQRLLGRAVLKLVQAQKPASLITKLKVTKADGTVLLV